MAASLPSTIVPTMLCGHYSVAFALKAFNPRVPLAYLFFAVQAADIAFFALVLAGVERVAIHPERRGPLATELPYMPFSHSLVATFVFAVALALAGWAARRAELGAVLAVGFASHWLLDLPVHVIDLPIGLSGGARVGFGLWTNPTASLVLELGLVIASYALLRRHIEGRSARRCADGLCALLVALSVTYYAVPPPPWVWIMALGAEALYVGLVVLAAVVDTKGRNAAVANFAQR